MNATDRLLEDPLQRIPANVAAPDQKDTVRIETFSDGVFCIAVTLLSLEVGIETLRPATDQSLVQALLHKWPVYFAYAVSFVNVLLAWMGHHSLFKCLRKTDSTVMIANGVLLMLVALVPFPTKTLGAFLLTDALKSAVVFYTGYFVLISLGFRFLWFAACRRPGLLVPNLPEKIIRKTTRNENLGLLCNAVIAAVAFVSPWLALGCSFGMWVYWLRYA